MHLLTWILLMAVLTGRQSGTATIAASGSSTTPTISSYTLANSILMFSYKGGTADPSGSAVRGYKASTTTLTFARHASPATSCVIEWELLEFDTDASVEDVQRTNLGTVAINAVTLAKSFLCPTGFKQDGTGWDRFNEYARWKFNSTTEIEVLSLASLASFVANVQVVEFTGCDVQEVAHAPGAINTTTTDDTISAVTVANSLLISTMTHNDGNARFDAHGFRGQITTTTNVNFEREATNNITFVWNYFVCEFTDGTSLQQGTQTVVDTDGQDDITLSALTIAESASVLSGSGTIWAAHGTHSATADEMDDVLFTAVMTTTTNLQVTRVGTVGEALLAYQVIEWNTGAAAEEFLSRHYPQGVSRGIMRGVA